MGLSKVISKAMIRITLLRALKTANVTLLTKPLEP